LSFEVLAGFPDTAIGGVGWAGETFEVELYQDCWGRQEEEGEEAPGKEEGADGNEEGVDAQGNGVSAVEGRSVGGSERFERFL